MTLDAVFFFSCLSVTQDSLYNTLSYCNTKSNWRYKPSVYCVCYNPRQRYVDKISAEAASDKLIKNESLFNKFKAKKKLQGVWTIKICFYFYYVIQIQVFWGTSHFLLTLVHRNSSCMTIFLYIKNIPADFTLLDHVSKTRSMIGQNLRS